MAGYALVMMLHNCRTIQDFAQSLANISFIILQLLAGRGRELARFNSLALARDLHVRSGAAASSGSWNARRALPRSGGLGVGVAVGISMLGGVGVEGAHAQVLSSTTNINSRIHVYSPSSGQYLAPVVTPSMTATGLAADDAGRKVYLTDGRALFVMSYDPPRQVVRIGTFSPAVTMGGGLAYDSLRGVLLGTAGSTHSPGLYTIDPQTAACVLVANIAGADFGGMDYDRVGDRLLLANDLNSNTGTIVGRGLYSWPAPFATNLPVRIAAYPLKRAGTIERDVDGVGVGFGRAYLCTDESEWMYVYNLTTGQYESPVLQTGFGIEAFAGGATVAPSFFIGGNNDLSVTLSGPSDCAVYAGGIGTLIVQVRNAGTQGLTGARVDCFLGAGTVVESTSPSATVTAGGVRFNWPTLAVNQTVTASVIVAFNQAGEITSAVVAACDQSEQDVTNNSAAMTVTVLPSPPATAAAVGVFSTIASSASSLAPGQAGSRFSGELGRPYSSADGSRWIARVRLDGAGATVLTIGETTGAGPAVQVVARTGAFPSITGDLGGLPPLEIDHHAVINSSGTYVFSGTDGRTPTVISDQGGGFVLRGDISGTADVIAREGDGVPGIFGTVYADPRGGVAVSGEGNVSLLARISGSGVTSTNNRVILGENGWDVLVRTDVSVPSSQSDGIGGLTLFPLKALDVLIPTQGFSRDEQSLRLVATGRLGGSAVFPAPGGVDLAAMHSDSERGGLVVAIQENCGSQLLSPPLTAADGAPFAFATMQSDGAAVYVGRDSAGGRWIQMNGTLRARTGEFIHAGASLRWSTTRVSDAFVGASATAIDATDEGVTHFVVAGGTQDQDSLRDQAAVLDGLTLLARENDPVDLDNNGVFDDGVMIASFVPFRSFLTATKWYSVVNLRSYAASLGCAADVALGQALIAVPRPDAQPVCPADFNADGGVDGTDIEAFFSDWIVSSTAADVNLDGGVDGSDVEFFFVRWSAGGC